MFKFYLGKNKQKKYTKKLQFNKFNVALNKIKNNFTFIPSIFHQFFASGDELC